MSAAADAVAAPAGSARWLALVAALFVQAVSVGATLAVYGFFQVPVSQEFGVRPDTVTLGFLIFMVAQAFAGPALGPAADRLGPRVVMIAGGIVCALGCAVIYEAHSLAIAAVGFALLVAVGAVGLGPMPTSKLIVGWFPDRPGTALGINAIGPSIGAMLAPKLVQPVIDGWGWRSAVAAIGAAFAVSVPLVLALAREAKSAAPAAASPGAARSDLGFLRERNFWVLTVAFGFSIPPLVALGNAYPPYATETRGLTGAFVSTLLLASGFVGIGANLAFGWLADRFNRKVLIWIAQAPLIASCALLATTPPISWLLPMAIVTGVAQGTTALWTASIGDRFAPESFGRVMGTMGLCMLPVTLTAVQVPMSVFGATHRFEPAFAGFAVVVALAAVSVLFLGPKRAAA